MDTNMDVFSDFQWNLELPDHLRLPNDLNPPNNPTLLNSSNLPNNLNLDFNAHMANTGEDFQWDSIYPQQSNQAVEPAPMDPNSIDVGSYDRDASTAGMSSAPSTPVSLIQSFEAMGNSAPTAHQQLEGNAYVNDQNQAINEAPGPNDMPLQPVEDSNLREPNWTYGVEVWPAADVNGQLSVWNHDQAIQEDLILRGVTFGACQTTSVEEPGLCRQYTIAQRDRDNDQLRLAFLQAFSYTRNHNKQLRGYRWKMVKVFEDRELLPTDPFTATINDGDQDGDEHNPIQYSPVGDLMEFDEVDDAALMAPSPDSSEQGSSNSSDPLTPSESQTAQSKPKKGRRGPRKISGAKKPDREATMNADGLFCCEFPGCDLDEKIFKRKCEWTKHMDRHERPYFCNVPGCGYVRGFTYDGGVLRHQREVHNMHGGPKANLHCPHASCKRHTGKGFSRIENLNEHLRRVHGQKIPKKRRSGSPALPSIEEEPQGQENTSSSPEASVVEVQVQTGSKRKPDTDLREEVKRLQVENQDLRAEVEAQNRQSMAMMQQLAQMTNQINDLSQIAPGHAS